jgi:hypothetical protein
MEGNSTHQPHHPGDKKFVKSKEEYAAEIRNN